MVPFSHYPHHLTFRKVVGMKLWKWLGRNVHSFQALGALAVFGTVVVGLWFYLQNATKRDLLLWAHRNESTIPVDLIEWSTNVEEELQLLPKKLADEPLVLDRLRALYNVPRKLDRSLR
jgi:hypothetical protein